MTIKLNGSTAGSVALDAPASTTGNADIAFKLPVADGSANQLLKTDGSGNLGWATDVGGKFSSYAVINHSVAYNQGAGTFTNGAWRTRELNTEVTDVDGIVSISSNQFTLQAGTYLIKAQSPAYRVDQHVIRLYNVTDSSVDGVGMAVMTSSSFASQTVSTLVTRITISGAKAFEIQHQCQTTHATYGLGLHHGISGADSIYTIVEIYKES